MRIIESELHIDNRQALSRKYPGGTLSGDRNDEDILLEGYRSSGEEILYELEGIFAFTIWDEESAYHWCARDQLGNAVLYYAHAEGVFLSASSLTLLLKKLPHKPKPNLLSMREFAWYGGCINPEHTMYEGVYRLPPGHQMTVKKGKTKVSRYWDPKSIKVNYSLTLEEASETFLKLFREAVSHRLAEDGTTGCELSGGLDSSSVFCVGKEQGGDMEAYSMRFEKMACDEGRYIDKVLAHTQEYGVAIATGELDYREEYNLHFNYRLSPHWPHWITSFFQYPMFEAMQKNGIHTALTGQGGDQVMVGGSLLLCFDYLKRLRLRAFWREYRALSFIRRGATIYIIKNLIRRLFPAAWIERLNTLRYSLYGSEAPPPKSYQKYDAYPHTGSPTQRASVRLVSGARHAMFMDTNVYRIAQEHYGIDFYHPFFDLKVVEYLLCVPPEFKYLNRNVRQLHRRAMEGILPEAVRTRRTKASFSDMIPQYLDTLDPDTFWREAHIVNLRVIDQKKLDHIRLAYGNADADTKASLSINYWRIVNLEQWYRSNYDSEKA